MRFHSSLLTRHSSIPLAAALLAVAGALLAARASQAPASGGEGSPAAACGTACHRLPPPGILPRASWRESIERMQAIRDGDERPSSRTRELAPDFAAALAWYERRAPVSLEPPAPWPGVDAARFSRRWLTPPDAPPTPVISNVQLFDLDGDRRLELVACDMRHGMVFLGRPYDPAAGLTLIAKLASPSHATATDLDGDGVQDLLVADLGEFLPRDHNRGAVVWLRGLGEGRFSPFGISGLPRVADVRAMDVDGDGDRDMIVAAFGYRRTGGVLLLENRTKHWSRPVFAPRTLDPRPGAVAIEPVDLDRDDRMDFVTAIAQEHEQVVAFVNTGGGAFRTEVLYEAPHPNWGFSGLALADLDGDRDTDILLANGDTFDDSLLKPYHGVAWLENLGAGGSTSRGTSRVASFTHHQLARLPGPHGVTAVDLDGDGDVDVVASALIAGGGDAEAHDRLPALVWLEQTSSRRFERRTLALGHPRHATVAAGDVDGDGDPDLAVGEMATTGPAEGWVQMWENEGGRAARP